MTPEHIAQLELDLEASQMETEVLTRELREVRQQLQKLVDLDELTAKFYNANLLELANKEERIQQLEQALRRVRTYYCGPWTRRMVSADSAFRNETNR